MYRDFGLLVYEGEPSQSVSIISATALTYHIYVVCFYVYNDRIAGTNSHIDNLF